MKRFYRKEFGQNFLTKRSVAKKLVYAANVTKEDTVLEVGAGAGMVTQYLCGEAGKVIAIEIDKRFIKMLKSRFLDDDHVEIVEGDIMKIQPDKFNLSKGNYKVVGSLPYNISKKIIKKFLEAESQPIAMSVILQKEVALDFTSQPPKASFLSNYVSIYSDATYIEKVPKEFFDPEPKVDGAIVTFNDIEARYDDHRRFAKFLKSAFLNPRKMLINNLSAIFKSEKADLKKMFNDEQIDHKARASNLTIDQWHTLFIKIYKKN